MNFPALNPSKGEPLIEDLIAQTSLIGRQESHLIEGMAGWTQRRADLDNTSLMRRHIESDHPAVNELLRCMSKEKDLSKELR